MTWDRVTVPTLCIVLLSGAMLTAGRLDGSAGLVTVEVNATADEQRLYLPDARYTRPLLLGHHGAAADLLWIRIIQYLGAHFQGDKRYPQLAQALDLITSLDPYFVEPYRFGALYLEILAREPDAAVALLEKGAAANPDRWEFPHDLGRYYFLEAQDDAKALLWWERATKLPGRPEYLPRFVARLYARTGHTDTALELWTELYETAQNDHFRSIALEEIERLKAGGSRMVSP